MFSDSVAQENKIIAEKLEELQRRIANSQVDNTAIILKADDFNWVHVQGQTGSFGDASQDYRQHNCFQVSHHQRTQQVLRRKDDCQPGNDFS